MRLKRTDVSIREGFVQKLFEANPTLSVAKANEQVKAKFGNMMRAQRMYAIRKTASKPAAVTAGARGRARAKTIKHSKKQRRPVTTGRRDGGPAEAPFPMLIRVGTGEGAALKNALTVLRGHGLTNLAVDHDGDSYAVIVSV